MKTIEEIITKLEEAANLEGSELGEWWGNLINLHSYISYCASENFKKVWEEEIRKEYEEFSEKFEIVEEEELRPTRKRKFLREKE